MFDHDFKKTNVRANDVRLLKRKFKLFKGFRKEELTKYTGDQAEAYFEGFIYFDIHHINFP